MKKTEEKNMAIILLFFLGSILTMTGLAYQYRDEIDLTHKLKYVKERFFTTSGVSVKFHVVANIGDKSLRIKYYVPCKDLKQKYRLLKKLPGIKHEMLMAMSRMELIKSVEGRDFNRIKKYSLQVVNYFTKDKINNIYIDFFFLN